MSADILLFSSQVVPIGKDQKQHLEFARDIAVRINNHYQKDIFVLPEPFIHESAQTVIGLDGRKMSKSYDNTIPLFLPPKPLKKLINKIVTNSQTPEDVKDPDSSYVYSIHQLFLDDAEKEKVAETYRAGGMGWGHAKKSLFETLDAKLAQPREKYNLLMENLDYLDEVLAKGAIKARAIAGDFMESLRNTAGLP